MKRRSTGTTRNRRRFVIEPILGGLWLQKVEIRSFLFPDGKSVEQRFPAGFKLLNKRFKNFLSDYEKKVLARRRFMRLVHERDNNKSERALKISRRAHEAFAEKHGEVWRKLEENGVVHISGKVRPEIDSDFFRGHFDLFKRFKNLVNTDYLTDIPQWRGPAEASRLTSNQINKARKLWAAGVERREIIQRLWPKEYLHGQEPGDLIQAIYRVTGHKPTR